MSLFLLFYIFVLVFFIYSGFYILFKYKKYSGIFFFFSSLFFSIWALLYIIIFEVNISKDILLYIFRFMYSLSFLGMLSMIFFIYYFGKRINKNIIYKISIFYIFIFIFFIGNDLILDDLKYISDKDYYFETYGVLYNLILIFYVLFLPVLFFIYFKKQKNLSYINRARLKIIIYGFAFFIFFSILFYVILPYFGKFYFENIAIVFSIPFILSVIYSINNYKFIDLKISFGNIFVFIFSLFLSIFIIYFLKEYLNLSESFKSFWNITETYSLFDILLGIILFYLLKIFLSKVFLVNNSLVTFESKLNKLKSYIPYIDSIVDLNTFLSSKFSYLFKIKYFNIYLFKSTDIDKEIYKYFYVDKTRDIFINDLAFIEENKYKFNVKKLSKDLNILTNIIFPIFDNEKKLIGIIEFGNKSFSENYSFEEISILKDFNSFILGHLKYIDIYSKINDLNLNLDKKVDEKTIEFNNLINKQKEFISMSSHEIKTPIMAASMHIENFVDDIESGDYDKTYLKQESNILKEQIFKISDLVKNIFNVQKHEIKDVGLYLEKVKISDLIIGEYDILSKIYPNINFELDIDDEIGFLDLDKIQFTQVISNLLNNAIKFSNKNNPKIKISLLNKNEKIRIIVEDNGSGFNDGQEKSIFDKYSTGHGSSVGIGMGLYLCKKIVELHNGTICAKNSGELKGASFEILIPKK